MSKHKVSKLFLSCVVAGVLSTSAATSFAQNKGGDSAVLRQLMMQRQAAMKNPASAKMMGDQSVRMIVMDQMAHNMATDPEFQKMHAEMMKDPACMESMKECKMMMADTGEMKKVQNEIMADPNAMEMVMSKAMMMDMARTDPDMMKMMDHGKMGAGKMDHAGMNN